MEFTFTIPIVVRVITEHTRIEVKLKKGEMQEYARDAVAKLVERIAKHPILEHDDEDIAKVKIVRILGKELR